ncbi:MAG: peptidoglycan DD-metalloendopeptidase family protein [Prevotellaceae bacterium]|nr:peptidoglycan DD-metalloendopeptidase family protein [Prevotellaceae bacterium]
MNLSTIKKSLSIVLLSMTALGGFAQDKIARQAPSDKRLKDIHNVKLNNTVRAVDLANPAADIYTDWTDEIRKCSGHVPANHKIDLRGFCMPTPSRKINSKFGPRWGRRHEGLDVKVYIGDTIRAAFDGKVRICKFNARGYGYYIVIRHPNGLETLYGHLSKQIVKKDQIVRAGEPIGLGGNTGRSYGSHLHFETRLLGQPIDPALMFDFENQDVTGDFYSMSNGVISKASTSAAARTASNITAEDHRQEAAMVMANDNTEVASVETSSNDAAPSVKAAAPKQRTSKSRSYSVKSGDTLYSIARKHGTTVAKLQKLNGLKSNSVLRIGQVIKCS